MEGKTAACAHQAHREYRLSLLRFVEQRINAKH
jgi:hypothetical protein